MFPRRSKHKGGEDQGEVRESSRRRREEGGEEDYLGGAESDEVRRVGW